MAPTPMRLQQTKEADVKAMGMSAAVALVTLFTSSVSLAADQHAATAAPAHATTTTGDAHPPAANQAILPPPGIRWPAVTMIIVVGMFVAAMVVGPIVRMTLPPDEPPVAHGHDDEHGHGHDHAGHARPRTPLDGHGHSGGHGSGGGGGGHH